MCPQNCQVFVYCFQFNALLFRAVLKKVQDLMGWRWIALISRFQLFYSYFVFTIPLTSFNRVGNSVSSCR